MYIFLEAALSLNLIVSYNFNYSTSPKYSLISSLPNSILIYIPKTGKWLITK